MFQVGIIRNDENNKDYETKVLNGEFFEAGFETDDDGNLGIYLGGMIGNIDGGGIKIVLDPMANRKFISLLQEIKTLDR